MSWLEVIGGSPVNTASASYKEYNIADAVTLEWPLEAAGANVLADIMEFTSTATATVTMPAADAGSTGLVGVFANKGSNDISIRSSAGTLIVTIPPSGVYFVVLTDNSTADGEWSTYSFGGGTSGGTGSGASASSYASPSVVAIGGTLNQALPVTTVAADRSFALEDRGKLVNWTGGNGTLTLPAGTTLTGGWFVHIKNSGSGALVIDPSGADTIDGQSSVTLNPNETCVVTTDGANFFTISLATASGGGGGGSVSYISIDVAGAADYTLSSAQQGYTLYRLTGVLTGNRNIIVPAVVSQFTVRNETTGTFTLTVKTAAGTGIQVGRNESKILFCDGTNVKDSSTAGAAVPLAVSQGGTGAVTGSEARTNLGATAIGDALFTAASTAAGRTALGAGNTGSSLFTAATAAAAKSTLGIGAVGDVLFQAATAAAAKAALGLDQVNNTADVNKPLSTAMNNALATRGATGGNNTWTGANHFNVDGGAFTFSHASAVNITLWDRNWGARNIHLNDGLMGFLSSAGGWTFRVDNSGNANFEGQVYAVGNFHTIANVVTPNGSVYSNNFIFYSDGAQDTGIYWAGDGAMQFNTNGVARVSIGTHLNLINGACITNNNGDGFITLRRINGAPGDWDRAGSNGAIHAFRRADNLVGTIQVTTTGTTYLTTSDGRLKPERRDFDPRSWLMETEVVEHNWINEKGKWSFGVIAQNEYLRFPDAVSVGKGEPGEEGFEPWQVDYKQYVAPMLRAWQLDRTEMLERIARLEREVRYR